MHVEITCEKHPAMHIINPPNKETHLQCWLALVDAVQSLPSLLCHRVSRIEPSILLLILPSSTVVNLEDKAM